MDGGIRRGSDVEGPVPRRRRGPIGRVPGGLAANGTAGVENVLDVVQGGIDATMRGIGVGSIHDLTADHVIVPDGFSPPDQLTFTPPPSAARYHAGTHPAYARGGQARRSHEPRRREGRVLLLPLGATEQHGLHLPLDTDAVIVRTVAESAAGRVTAAVVAPVIAIGASGEHTGFAGTLSIGTEVLAAMIVEDRPHRRSGVRPCHHRQYPRRHLTPYVPPPPPASSKVDRSACGTPVSTTPTPMPAPSRRRSCSPSIRSGSGLTKPSPAPHPLREILDDLRTGGVAAVSPNGVLADPTDATPARGEEILAGWVHEVVALLES